MKIEFLNYELNPNLSSIPQDVSHQTRQGLHELNQLLTSMSDQQMVSFTNRKQLASNQKSINYHVSSIIMQDIMHVRYLQRSQSTSLKFSFIMSYASCKLLDDSSRQHCRQISLNKTSWPWRGRQKRIQGRQIIWT